MVSTVADKFADHRIQTLEQKLQEKEELLHRVIETVPDAITIVRKVDARYLLLNKAFYELTGYTEEEALGKSFFEIQLVENRKKLRRLIVKLIKKGEIFKEEFSFRSKEGLLLHSLLSIKPFRYGDEDCYVVVATNIAIQKEREKELQESEQRYFSLLENTGMATIIIEEDMTISTINNKFEELTGYKKKNIENYKKFPEFVVKEDRERLINYHTQRRVKENEAPVEYECKIRYADGKIKDVLVRVGIIPGTKKSIALFLDITARKQAEKALREREQSLYQENIRLKSTFRERYRLGDIIGKSKAMQKVYQLIMEASASNANIIIHGESGTGKELVARAIHNMSTRGSKEFVPVNCGAIPNELIESEFFGHKKGAFTGAHIDKPGFLDKADGGTLFLDEIGEIGLNMQVKLLRAIEGSGYTPVGDATVKNADFRVVAATHQDLSEMVANGKMRDDFFYRINIIPITIPPLREREGDIPLLIFHFLDAYSDSKAKPLLPASILEALIKYDWPGNVRELQNVLHRYITLKRLDIMDIRPSVDIEKIEESLALPQDSTLKQAIYEFEKRYITHLLETHKWHRGKVASILGIDRRTLFRKIKAYEID